LDELWSHGDRDETKPSPGLQHIAQQIVPADSDPQSAVGVAANLIANELVDLASALDAREIAFCHFPGARTVDLIDTLADDVPGVPRDELLDAEVQRQDQDLADVRSEKVDAISIKARAVGASLWEQYWVG